MNIEDNIQEILATSYDHEDQIVQLEKLFRVLATQFLDWANGENGNLPVNAEELYSQFKIQKGL